MPGTVPGFGDDFLNWRDADHGADNSMGCVLILNYVLMTFAKRVGLC